MNRTTRAISIILSVVLLAAGGIWYFKRQLWKTQPTDAIPIAQKESNPLDLRPAAIAKLQQLVKNASDGLYKLRVDSLFTDISSGTIVLRNIGLYPDSNTILRMQREQGLPDDLYVIELESLRITGISLADILHRRSLHFCCIAGTLPQITVHHKLQPYNRDERARAERQTMFRRLHAQIDKLVIDTLLVAKGTLTDYTDGHRNIYRDVSISLWDILLDSAAERDQSRFLFAKKASIETGAVSMPADKSGYDLGMGSISILAEQHQLTVRNLSLHPHAGREAFVHSQKERKCVYDVAVPLIVLNRVNWWAAAHGESLIAEDAEVSNARVNVFMDQRVPVGALDKTDFPQQELMAISKPVSVRRVVLKGVTLTYEQYTTRSGKQAAMSFDDINLTADNMTNVAAEVATRPVAHAHASCRFMKVTPLLADFALELPRNKRGAFKVGMNMGVLTPDLVNGFSEGMGLVRFSSGQMQDATAQIEGNNDNLHGNITVRYTDLHIEPLKEKEATDGHLKKKHITKKVANVLFVKNNNPGSNGDLRKPDFSMDRTNEGNFFSFIWEGLKLGLLKTIGVPAKFAGKPDN